MIFGSLPKIHKGIFRNIFLLAFISFHEPIEKDLLISYKGTLGIGGNRKRFGELLPTSFKNVNELIPRTTGSNLQKILQSLVYTSDIIGNSKVFEDLCLQTL